jgi:hypothetical protein
MTTEEIRHAVAEANKMGLLIIKGYRSEGSGAVLDYRLLPLGSAGYLNTLRAAVEAVTSPAFKRPDLATYNITEEAWAQGFREQVSAWYSAIERITSGTAESYNPKEQLICFFHEGYWIRDPDDGVTVVKNLTVLESTIVTPPTKTVSDPLNSVNEVVRTKALVRKLSPIGTYIGRLNLATDKLKTIE